METYSTKVRVIYGDTDAAGVVYNANYLRYFEIGRTEMMRALIASYKAIEDMGFVMPLTESYIRYKAPATYDDLLIIETEISELKKFSAKFSYRIYRDPPKGEKPPLLTKGSTTHACIGKDGKLRPIPQKLHQQLAQLCTTETPKK